jgi:histidine triad (HIT) family protein
MNEDCIFCKIANKEIPAKIEYEDDFCISFHDINPRAAVHLLVIPKKHIPTLKDLEPEDEKIAGKLIMAAQKVAKKLNLESYKQLKSVGKAAGQEVFHIHLHVMSPY